MRTLVTRTHAQHGWTALALLAGILVLSTLASASEEQRRYFDGLRARGLYVVAEEYAQRKLAEPALSIDRKVDLVIELSRTLVEHGRLVSGQSRDELWGEAERILNEALKQPRIPRRALVESHRALNLAIQGRTLRFEAELSPQNTRLADKAVERLRSAVTRLRDLLEAPASSPGRTSSNSPLAELEGLSPAERQSLQFQLQFALADSEYQLSTLLPPGHDRTGALLNAAEVLDDLNPGRLSAEQEFDVRLLQSRIASLQGDDRRAQAALRSAERVAATPTDEDRILAEKIRDQLSSNNLVEALTTTDLRSSGTPVIDDELRSVMVEAYLSGWRRALADGRSEPAKLLLDEAERQHELTRGIWRLRTTHLIEQARESQRYGTEVARHLRRARAAYTNRDLTTAAAEYANAAAAAQREQRLDESVDFLFTRGSILLESGQFAKAADAFEELVARHPRHDRAPDADLLHCYALARVYEAAPTTDHRERLTTALEEHRRQFATKPTAVEATWMLAVLQEQRRQWTDAVELYQQIPEDHARAAAAAVRIARLYEQIVARLRTLDGPVEEWQARAIHSLTELLDTFPLPPKRLSREQSEIALILARLILEQSSPGYADADALLARIADTIRVETREAATAGQPLDPTWNTISHAVSQLRIISLAGQGRLGEARHVLGNLDETDPTSMLGILHGLTEMTSFIPEEQRRELGHLQLQAARRLESRRDTLDPIQRQQLDECQAQAFVATGDLPEAAEIYERLLAEQPRNRRLIDDVIKIYMDRGKPSDLQKAKSWWMRRETYETPGSTNWLTARLKTAELMHRLGERDEARKLVKVTRILYPNPADSELKAGFDRLARELDRQDQP